MWQSMRVVMLSSLAWGCRGERTCEGDPETHFELEEGCYHAFAPQNHDGGALPVVMMLHAWSGSPQQYYDNDAVMSDFSDLGVLVVLPQGLDDSWKTTGSPEDTDRDDVAFLTEVFDDVAERWETDGEHVMGFSQGASMAESFAQQRGERLQAVSAISGGFWEEVPGPQACPEVVPAVRHTHGTADATWPIEGRAVGSSQQAPIAEDVDFWRQCAGCSETVVTTDEDGQTCHTWKGCSAEIRYCEHDGGHERLDGWVTRQVGWMLAQ